MVITTEYELFPLGSAGDNSVINLKIEIGLFVILEPKDWAAWQKII